MTQETVLVMAGGMASGVANLFDDGAPGGERPAENDGLLIASWYPDLLAWIEIAGRSMTGPRRGPEASQGWWNTLDLPSR